MHPTVFDRQKPARHLIDSSLANSVQRPFWLDDIAPRADFSPLEGEQHADLVIVGGGYLGLWTALLAKECHPDLDIVLLEANRIAEAASGRNGGFCEASLTHGEENGRRHWPEELSQLEALGLRNLDQIEETLTRYGIDCDFERTGVLAVAVEPYQEAQLLEEPGYLSRADVQAQVASPTFLAGLWEQDGCALLHPGKLGAGLTRVVAGMGVRIHEHSAATTLKKCGEGMEVRVGRARVRAPRVVLATNAFPSLIKRYRLHTVPIYDYVLMTEPLTPHQRESIGWKNRQGLADMGNRFHYYRLTKDDRILFGGHDAVYHFGRRIDPRLEDRTESFRNLAGHFFTTFPQLAGVRFSHRWGGVIDTSTRFCSFFGDAHDGRVVTAAGFTGLGVGATRFAAAVLLDKIDGIDSELTRLRMVRERPLPFPPEPFAWLAVRATQWALKRADNHEGRRNLLLRSLDAMGLGFDS